MRLWLRNVFRLGLKEMAALAKDPVLLGLMAFVFTVSVYTVAHGVRTEVRNAAIAVVDGDGSQLSRRIIEALQPPYFLRPLLIDRHEVDAGLDRALFTFALDLPPGMEADLLAGRTPIVGLAVDATAMTQAGIGTRYISEIVSRETDVFLGRHNVAESLPVELVIRAYFNPNLDSAWFMAVMQVVQNITILSIILVGAAVIRERERGTIEHLLVMPVTASEIAAAKIWANGLVILFAVALSLHFVVNLGLGIPVAGSRLLFLGSAAFYLFATTAMGILLATFANSMPQFALMAIPCFVVMNLLSGSTTPVESMPLFFQIVMKGLPSTHFVALSQAVLYRGAGIDVIWPQLALIAFQGSVFLALALARFKAMLARQA
ncbi:ABC-2 type transport system permease protein [Dongia mobilis]|uniref:ABC-2 type transport system permease protein n=1 Tax=Dongia mobilis TaxID=578943 RepID=A0A4R6WU11_9PROT|nr:ABC transporter permease [Dongia mobilis]TDQ83279.1 ABC-2 type transport system permease protein [Dongia mobilis]